MNNVQYKKIILDIIDKYTPEAKVILFGSRARKDAKPGSDIDIAIDLGEKVDSKKMNALLMALDESALPIYFDIVDLSSVSDDMRKKILKDGIIWKS